MRQHFAYFLPIRVTWRNFQYYQVVRYQTMVRLESVRFPGLFITVRANEVTGYETA